MQHLSAIAPMPSSLKSPPAGVAAPGTVEALTEPFTVVVVDDSPVYRKMIENVLAQEYTVLFAKNGREALETLAKHRPSLVITDWEMPDITGIELCKKIRDEQGSYMYVILLTGNADKGQVIEGLGAGADDYLTKPFHSGELLARVGVGRRVVELHRQIETKNLQLQKLALTDSLTGLPNRRAVEDWTRRELCGAARHGFALWIAVADLDHFKKVNDTYGHEGGDVVLKRFAELLRTGTRSSNMCGRIGGEEFLLVLGHIEGIGVQIAIERIRRELEAEKISFGGNVITVTASFGIAGFQGQNAPELKKFLRVADAALYEAKRKGRNRLEFAPGLCWRG